MGLMAAAFARYGSANTCFLANSSGDSMGPKPSQPQTAELFRPRLDELINMRHPLVKLAAQIGRYAQAKQLSGQKRGITRTLKAMIKRRSAIEPAIGHMKMDGRLARNPLKGALGDALHAVMCGRARPAPDPGRAAAFLRPILAADAGGHRRVDRHSGRAPTGVRVKTELFRADYLWL
ncbi:hypothetical protein AVHM3334_12835 [Acidovorax sp. SUPP3334]|nr:hypothetical protein AVHM3334_12835 [Acidovorax sp. SUPP3334]